MNTDQNTHILNIKQLYPENTNISRPVSRGLVHDVYIVETKYNDKFVCRFSSPKTAKHNLYVSNLLNSNGIRVPDVSLHKFDEEYCETYPFIIGNTLFERIQQGVSEEKLDDIYRQIFDICYTISKIPYNFDSDLYVPVTAKIAKKFFKAFNVSPVALCHTDLNAKNIVLDNQDNVYALLDLDAVYPESMAFTLINLVKEAHLFGYNTKKIASLYYQNDVKPKIISINTQAQLYSALKQIGRLLLPEHVLKQILTLNIK
jgi:hypothetical protein